MNSTLSSMPSGQLVDVIAQQIINVAREIENPTAPSASPFPASCGMASSRNRRISSS